MNNKWQIIVFSTPSGTLGKANSILYGTEECRVPDLQGAFSTKFRGHNLILTSSGDKLLNCGGSTTKECHYLDINQMKWVYHSTLTNDRYISKSVTMPNGAYIFGGSAGAATTLTSDFLPKNSNVWQTGPPIPDGFKSGCTVQLSQTELLLIGGRNVGESANCLLYFLK